MRSSGFRYIPEPPAEGDTVPLARDDGVKLEEGENAIDTEDCVRWADGLLGVVGLGDRSPPWTL